MSAIIINGSIVHYEALGRGRPVLFLHGWVGSWRYWIPCMQVASASYRAYALDLFGFGETSRDPLHYDLEKQADLINFFLDHLGIGKVAIVGHGLGALVGFTFMRSWPNSVDRIMAINCPLDYEAVHNRLRSASPDELTSWLSNRSPETAAALADASKADQNAVAASLAGLQTNNLFGEVFDKQVPCLLVYGLNDPAITAPAPGDERTQPAHLHQLNLEGVGHFPMIEEPGRFNRLLTDFLALDSGFSPRELQLKEQWRRRVR